VFHIDALSSVYYQQWFSISTNFQVDYLVFQQICCQTSDKASSQENANSTALQNRNPQNPPSDDGWCSVSTLWAKGYPYGNKADYIFDSSHCNHLWQVITQAKPEVWFFYSNVSTPCNDPPVGVSGRVIYQYACRLGCVHGTCDGNSGQCKCTYGYWGVDCADPWVCFPGQAEKCPIANGEGQRTCLGALGQQAIWSVCRVLSCHDGYQPAETVASCEQAPSTSWFQNYWWIWIVIGGTLVIFIGGVGLCLGMVMGKRWQQRRTGYYEVSYNYTG